MMCSPSGASAARPCWACCVPGAANIQSKSCSGAYSMKMSAMWLAVKQSRRAVCDCGRQRSSGSVSNCKSAFTTKVVASCVRERFLLARLFGSPDALKWRCCTISSSGTEQCCPFLASAMSFAKVDSAPRSSVSGNLLAMPLIWTASYFLICCCQYPGGSSL